MAAYQTQQINVGSIAAPDVGSVFANFADRINKQQSNQLDNMRQAAQYDRQQVLNQRADQDWNRQQSIYKAKADVAADFAAHPYAEMYGGKQENAALDRQVLDTLKSNPNAFNVLDDNDGKGAYTFAVGDNGEYSKDASGNFIKQYDSNLKGANLGARLQSLYETHKPFQEDAVSSIASELVKKSGGAISMADAMTEAKGIASGLPSRVALQEASDKNRKEQQDYYKDVADNYKNLMQLKLDIDKANQQGDIKTQDLLLEKYKLMNQGMFGTSSSSGGSNSGLGGKLSYDDINTYARTESVSPLGTGWLPWSDQTAVYDAINRNQFNKDTVPAAVTLQALKNATVETSTGRTFDPKKFDSETARLKELYIPPEKLQNFTVKDIPQFTEADVRNAMPTYVPRTIVDYKSNDLLDKARQVAPELFKGEVTTNGTVGATASGKNNQYIPLNLKDIKDEDLKDTYYNIKRSEGNALKSTVDSDGGYTIGYGYNMKQNAATLDKDLANAGLSPQQIYTAKFHPEQLEITNEQSQKLFNNVIPRYIDSAKNVLNKNGVNYDNLNSEVKATVNQMIYRGDLGNGAEYSKGLISAIKQNDLSAISNYIGANESKLPPEVVTRIRNDLAINEERARRGVTNNNSSGGNVNTTTTTTPATTNSNKDSNTVNDIISKFEELNKVSPTLQSTDSLFNMSNTLGFGGSRYGQHDISNFRNEVNRNKHAIENLLTPDNLVLVGTQAAELENSVNDTNNKLSDIITTRDGLLAELKTTGKTDISSLQNINKKYSELMTLRNTQQAQADKINEVYNRMVDIVQNDRAGNAAEEATVLVNEAMRKAYDPTASEALWELAQTGFTYVGIPKTKAMYSFLNAPAKVAKGTTKTGSKLPVVQGSARTVSEGTFKREAYIPKNSDVLAEIGEVFKSPNIKSDPVAKEKLAVLAAKYPEFADEIWRQFQKL